MPSFDCPLCPGLDRGLSQTSSRIPKRTTALRACARALCPRPEFSHVRDDILGHFVVISLASYGGSMRLGSRPPFVVAGLASASSPLIFPGFPCARTAIRLPRRLRPLCLHVSSRFFSVFFLFFFLVVTRLIMLSRRAASRTNTWLHRLHG